MTSQFTASKNLMLHVGMHKTGSTSIQFFSCKNRSVLRDHNILYPSPGSTGVAHHGIGKLAYSGDQKGFEEVILKIIEEAELSNCSNILISSEVFCKSLEVPNTIYPILREKFRKIEIIFYVREPLSWTKSAYGQQVRQKDICYTGSYEDYMLSIIRSIEYKKRIQAWSRIFGRENVVVKSYESAVETGLIQEFFEAKEVNLTVNEDEWRNNVGLSPNAINYLRSVNKEKLPESERQNIVRLLTERQSQFAGGKYSLSEELANDLNKAWRETSIWLNYNFGIKYNPAPFKPVPQYGVCDFNLMGNNAM